MRFALKAASVLFAGLLSSAAFADEAPAPQPPVVAVAKKMPLRVVRVLAETNQALLFNKLKNTHVLVEIGKQIDGYTVDDIDEDSVTLTPVEGGAQVVLAGPDPSWRRHPASATPRTAPLPEDPYAAAAPVDPYADAVRTVEAPAAAVASGSLPIPSDSVRTVEAPAAIPSGSLPTGLMATPIAAGDGGVRTAHAPGSSPAAVPAPAPEDTSSSAAWGNEPAVISAPAPTVKPERTALEAMRETGITTTEAVPAADAPTVIARADVNAALANFGALAGSIRGSFTPAGARLDAVSPDSILGKAGLRNGDVITAINNRPLRSLDDAANLYARAGSMKAATIQLQRAGKPITLRLAFQ